MYFHDRVEAGEQLARRLGGVAFEAPVVLAVPRGGVPVAAPIARALGAELGVIVARKLGAPGNPELAIGATTAGGSTFIDAALARYVGADEDYLRGEVERQVAEARRREAAFDHRRRSPLAGRDAIVVDDGIATGSTVLAAVRAARAEGARRVFVAVPVASPRALETLAGEVDGVAYLGSDPELRSVGSYYDDFRQVDDAEVMAILDAHANRIQPGQ